MNFPHYHYGMRVGITAALALTLALAGSALSVGAAPPPAGPSASLTFVSDSPTVDRDTANRVANGLGGAGTEVYVKVYDTNGIPLDGVSVTLNSSRAAGTDAITGMIGGGAAQITVEGGLAGFYVSSMHAGSATFSATVQSEFPAVTVTDTLVITFTSTVSATRSSVTASPPSAVASGNAAIKLTVTANDVAGNPVPNRDVQVTASGATVSNVSPATDASGKANATLTSCAPGDPVVSVVVDGVALNLPSPAPHFSNYPAVDSGASTTASSVASLPADNATEAVITVTVKNICNVAIEGSLVTLASNRPADDVITAAGGPTNAAGQTTFRVRSRTVGTSTFTATAADIPLPDDRITITYTATGGAADPVPSTAQSTIDASPSAVAANNADVTFVTVTVRNAAGQPLAGNVVTVSSNRIADVVAIVSGTSNGAGQASFTVHSAQAGVATLSARLPERGLILSQAATVTFTTPGAPAPTPSPSPTPAPSPAPGPVASPPPGVRLIKLACPSRADVNHPCKAVYFATGHGFRQPFPNDKVYFSWYADFSGVEIVTAAQLSSYQLGQNITYRPGLKLIKFRTLAKTYAVSRGGRLRWITSEDLARSLYGADWNRKVDDVSDAFYTNYIFGADILATADYSPAAELAAAPTITLD